MKKKIVNYELIRQISNNDLTESWQAKNIETGELCFLKIINEKSKKFNTAFKKKYLIEVFNLQLEIFSSFILHPKKKKSENTTLQIEYNLLSEDIWKTLDRDSLNNNLKLLLPKIFFITDLLHEHNIVHCDIKMENFLISKNNNMKLIDLDFITKNNSKSDAILKGTQDHISPKILKNDIIDKSADYYSLGVLLEKALSNKYKRTKQISNIIKDLKEEFKHQKNNLLIEILYNNQFISKDEYDSLLKSLFSAFLLSKFKNLKKKNKSNIIEELLSIENNIIGINEEIISYLNHTFQNSKLTCLQKLKKIVKYCTLQKSGEFWICECSDNTFISILKDTYQYTEFNNFKKNITKLIENKLYYTAYLLLKEHNEQKIDSTQNKLFTLKHISFLANALNRLEESKKYFEKLIILNPPDLDKIKYEYATINIALNRYEEALSTISQYLNLNTKEEQRLKFENLKALINIRKKRLNSAEELLISILEISKNKNYLYPKIQSYYYLSILYWYKGDIQKSIYYSKKCIRESNNHITNSLKTAAEINLSFFYFETADYATALRIGKKALKQIDSIENYNKLSTLYNNIFYAAVRISKFSQAEKYLNKSIKDGIFHLNHNKAILYLLGKGFLYLNSSRYVKAQGIFKAIITSFETQGITKNIGKVYQNLIELSTYLDNKKNYAVYHHKAYDIFKNLNDTTSLNEIKILNTIYQYTNVENSKIDLKEVAQICEELYQQKSIYFSMLGIFYIFIISIERKIPIPKIDLDLNDYFKYDNVPLFEATRIIFQNQDKLQLTTDSISILKRIIPIFQFAKNNFIYGILMHLVGLKYLEKGNPKLSKKFMNLALQIFKEIGNETLILKVKNTLSKLVFPKDNSDKYNIIKEVSDILVKIQDYNKCLKHILEFTLDQTGAERAVLLIKKQDSNELKVKAYINCEDSSLEDIQRFSTSVTLRSFQFNEPLIIENALRDNRINKYKSIIANNIQSVISIPLKKGKEMLGVLYLDHHTIPALFDKNDIIFSFTLANLLAILISTSEMVHNIKIKNTELITEINRTRGSKEFITQDKVFDALFERLPTISKSNSPILLLGESGTGKEILAEMIHSLSNRSHKPLIKLNSSSLAENLIESELFGIENNVATGVKSREGKFSAADNGTLFIDEIGDMPLNIQAKILRAVEYQEFEKVGSNRTIKTDIRFIYATNKDLLQLVKKNKFREDLYYRINTIPIHIPPLRERKGDIPLLIDHFIKIYAANNNYPILSTEVKILLENYNWPGNVRELKNIIERICLLYSGKVVTLQTIPQDIKDAIQLIDKNNAPEILEKTRIMQVLEKNNWIESRAAKELRMPLSTLRRRIIKYRIKKS